MRPTDGTEPLAAGRTKRIAAIGVGERGGQILRQLVTADPAVELVSIADPDLDGARQRLAALDVPTSPEIATYHNATALLASASDDGVDGVVVATRCNLHAEIAVQIAEAGLPLFLEKPVAIDEQQLSTLAAAFAGRSDSVVVSFPLRVTPLFTAVLEIVRSGRLGQLNQVQAFNYVPYGGVYFTRWHRDAILNGGLWLQKATHDFDYINLLIDATPVRVVATETRKVYGGDMPFDLRCSGCGLVKECRESPQNLTKHGDAGGMGFGDHLSAFSEGITNHDSGSALIEYDDGVHASYAQNFVARKGAARHGAIITGYLATLEFNWRTNSIKVTDHHTSRVDDVVITAPAGGHGGGDNALARVFLDVIAGSRSRSTLDDGMVSVAMCLAARTSVATGRFETVRIPASTSPHGVGASGPP